LRALAKDSKWSLEQLQRQVAYDRLLERLYLTDDQWIVKGATALLARNLSVRASLDIDLFRYAQRDVAETDLRAAVSRDIGDWFRFELGATRPLESAQTARLPVVAFVGVTEWTRFNVDLSGDKLTMTGEPEAVPPLASLALPDFSQHGYRVYPLVDHIADKIVATLQLYGVMQLPSTRYRDLVDLVAIITGTAVTAAAQRVALQTEASRRNVRLPQRFDIPDRRLWEAGYAAEAGRSLLPRARTLDEALGVVRWFIDPILDGTAAGEWDCGKGRWTEHAGARRPPEVGSDEST
jgi:hypothetical protein